MRGIVADRFRAVVDFYVDRNRYLELAAAGRAESSEEGVALRERLLGGVCKLSWLLTGLQVRGVQMAVAGFSRLIIRTIDHYAKNSHAAKFVPVIYVETCIDLLHLARKSYPRLGNMPLRIEISRFFYTHFQSPIIHHQPTREYILMTVGGLFETHEAQRRQFAKFIDAMEDVTLVFLAQLFAFFGDTMGWTLVVNPIHRYICGNGFCLSQMSDPRHRSLFPRPDPIPPEEFVAHRRFAAQMLQYFERTDVWAHRGSDSSPLSFFKNCIRHTNWCVTELCAVLAGTSGSQALTSDVVDVRRRGASVYQYAIKMLRTIEGVVEVAFGFYFQTSDNNAGTVPAHNAPPISAASKALLVVELVGQCLARFGSPDSSLRRVLQLRIAEFAEFDEGFVLAPLVGTLINMMGPLPADLVAATEGIGAAEAMRMWRERGRGGNSGIPPAVEAFINQLVSTNVFFKQMAQARVDWSHAAVSYVLTGVDWPAVCRRAHANSHLLKGLPLAGMAYEALQVAREAKGLRTRTPSVLSASGTPLGGTAPLTRESSAFEHATVSSPDDDADDEALCAICCVAPLEVAFEPCGHSSCLPCIERHQISDRRCFFCKAEVTRTRAIGPGDTPVRL